MSKIMEVYRRGIARFTSWIKRRQVFFTERTLLQALQESEERFRTIADFTYDWEYWVNPQGQLVYASPSCERITGYPPQEFLKNPDFLLHITHPHDRAKIAHHQKTMAPHPGVCSLDFRIITRQGEERWIGHVCQPVFTSDGLWLGRRASNRDITERKQAEEALRESEQRFKAVVQKSPLGIGIVDSTGKLVECNQALADMVGYSQDKLLQLNFADFTHPEDLEREWQLIREMWAQQTDSYRMEKRYIRQDGTILWVNVTAAVTLEDESLKFGFAFVEDITERKQTDEALRESEEKFKLLFDNSTDAHILYKGNQFIECNQATLDMLGFKDKNQLLTRHPGEISPRYQRDARLSWEKAEAMIALAFEKGSHRFEWLCQRADGSELLLDVLLNAIRMKGETLIHGVWRDITERKQAEESMQRLNERFALATRAAYLGVWDWDIQKNALIWDDRMYELYGVKREDFGGAYETWLQGVHPDDAPRSHAEVQQAQRGEKDFDTEFRIVRPDGTVRWLKAYGQVTRDEAGNPLRMTGVNYDITARKEVEEALHQSERELRLTLEATTDGIWKWNFDDNMLFFSPRYYTMLGYDPDEFPANYDNWKNLIHPDDRERALATATEYLAAKPEVYENEFRLRTRRGDYRWIHSYARVVERNHKGEALRMIGNHVDITDRKQAEEKLKASLAEKEILLRELYHRTKNTMQVIRSMLMLQAAKMPENDQVQQLVHDTDHRILAMALVHEKLYQSQDLSHLNLGGYLEELSRQIVQSDALAAQRVLLTFDIEPVVALLDTAIPCGLLLNELLSNALKHAFPAERTGIITIKLFRNDKGLLELYVTDNGVGVPPDFDFRQQANLGLQLIMALAEGQMRGTIRFTSEQGGVTCQVEFPDTFYSPRV